MAFTYFFRDEPTLELIGRHVIPDLKRRQYINIWDAGCAMGPEAYSLAIVIREQTGHFMFRNVRIFASDIDESNHFGETIANGIYPEVEVKRLPPDILQRYFKATPERGLFQIHDELRKAIIFQRHDLLSLKLFREGFGLVVCKNVLLHFSPEQRIEVIQMFYQALFDGGYFVTEPTQKLPTAVEHLFRRVAHDGQVFQKVVHP